MKHREGVETARLLRALAALIEKSSPDEIASLLKGQASLSHTKKVGAERPDADAILLDMRRLAEKLQSLNSREEGQSLLSSMSLPRRNLEGLGRLLGVPILKTDNVSRLSEKIIESTIGSRLNSVAIRGDGSGSQ